MARQTFKVLPEQFVRRAEDDRLFGPGEEIDLDPAKVNIATLIANGAIERIEASKPDKPGDGK